MEKTSRANSEGTVSQFVAPCGGWCLRVFRWLLGLVRSFVRWSLFVPWLIGLLVLCLFAWSMSLVRFVGWFFVCSLIHWFVRSFVCCFVCWLVAYVVCWSVGLLVRWSVDWFVRSFVYLFIRSLAGRTLDDAKQSNRHEPEQRKRWTTPSKANNTDDSRANVERHQAKQTTRTRAEQALEDAKQSNRHEPEQIKRWTTPIKANDTNQSRANVGRHQAKQTIIIRQSKPNTFRMRHCSPSMAPSFARFPFYANTCLSV